MIDSRSCRYCGTGIEIDEFGMCADCQAREEMDDAAYALEGEPIKPALEAPRCCACGSG